MATARSNISSTATSCSNTRSRNSTPRDDDAEMLIEDDNKMLDSGYIALQAESHPTEFRKIEIMILEP